MKQTAHLKFIVLLGALVAMLGSTHVFAAETFEETLSAPNAITLDVSTGSGSIKVTSGSGREITVIGTVRGNRWGMFNRLLANTEENIQAVLDNPPVVLEGDVLTVGRIEDRSLRKSVNISFEIIVPADTTVHASTGSGSVLITDIAAPTKAGTGSGSIKLENIGGDTSAKAGSGRITADGIAGAFNGRSGSGNIHLSQTAPGDVNVSAGSGRLKLTGIVGALEAHSGSGRISVEGQPAGDWKLHAGSGSITVELPKDATFAIDAETNGGGVRIADHFSVDGWVSKKHVKGEVNGGGPEVRIDTGSGGIKIL